MKKDMTKNEKASITLGGTDSQYKSATVYAITQDNSDIHIIEVNNAVSDNKVTIELPPLSVVQIVFSDELSDEEVYEAPDIITEEVVYSFSELELSANGFPIIPLGEKEHLVKVVINSTAFCTSGASAEEGVVNADGSLNVADVAMLQKRLLGTSNATRNDWQAISARTADLMCLTCV